MTCAVWFNLDDTLTELTREYEEIYEEAIREAGLPELEGKYEEYTNRFFNYFRKNYAFPRRQALDSMLKDADDYDPDDIERFAEAWDRLEAEACELKDGIHEALKEIAEDHSIGILTNGTGPLQRRKLEETGIAELFDEVVVSSEEGVMKPDKKLFLAAHARLDADTDVIVSHRPKRDIVAGRKAGFRAIWVTRSDQEIPEDVASKVTEPAELPDAVEAACTAD